MIPYLYGLLRTLGALFEHGADVRGRLWTSWIEPWVRIPPPPLNLSIGSTSWFEGSLLMSLTVQMTAERGNKKFLSLKNVVEFTHGLLLHG